MVDLNAAGGASVGGLSAAGVGQTRRWTVTLIHPDAGQAINTTAPLFQTRVDTWDGGNAQVQLQVSTVATFATTVHDSTATQAHNAVSGRAVTGLLDGTTYYWRARGGDGTSWGPWTATRTNKVVLLAGRTAAAMTMNVGVALSRDPDAAAQFTLNVGVSYTPEDVAVMYVLWNMGVEITPDDAAIHYAYWNATADPPKPHLWFLRPTSGRSGDGIQVVGWGFGDLQSSYGGQVELDYGGAIGWVTVPVVSWQTFPAQADAFTDTRIIDQILGEIDPQHTIIGILVPGDALPPGYPLRVRTVTP